MALLRRNDVVAEMALREGGDAARRCSDSGRQWRWVVAVALRVTHTTLSHGMLRLVRMPSTLA